MRETRIRGGAAKAGSSTPSPDGQPHCHGGVDANGPGYGRPTPARHSRMGYSQTSAFTRSPEDPAPLEPSRPVYTTSPVGGTHYIEEEFGWHTCQDLTSNPASIAFRFGVDSWLSLDSDNTHDPDVRAQKPLGMPLPGRLNEFQSHPHAQTTLACSTVSASSVHQEPGFGYPK